MALGGITVSTLLPASIVVLLSELLDVLEVGGQLAVGGDYGTVHSRGKVVLIQRFFCVRADDVDGVRKEEITEEVCRFPRQLGRHVIDRADQDTWALKRFRVLVTVGVVQTEWCVNRRALVHEPLNKLNP